MEKIWLSSQHRLSLHQKYEYCSQQWVIWSSLSSWWEVYHSDSHCQVVQGDILDPFEPQMMKVNLLKESFLRSPAELRTLIFEGFWLERGFAWNYLQNVWYTTNVNYCRIFRFFTFLGSFDDVIS